MQLGETMCYTPSISVQHFDPGCYTDRSTIRLAVIVVYGGSAWLVLLLYGTVTLVSGAVRGVSPSRIISRLRPGSNRSHISITTLPGAHYEGGTTMIVPLKFGCARLGS